MSNGFRPGMLVETTDGTALIVADDGRRYISPKNPVVLMHIRDVAKDCGWETTLVADMNGRYYVDADWLADLLEVYEAKTGEHTDMATKLRGLITNAVEHAAKGVTE